MQRYLRSIAAATLALTLVAGAGPIAFADKGKGHDELKHERYTREHEHFVKVTGFTDLTEGDAWATPYITQLYLAGLTKGDGHGRFNPKGSISQAEAVTMVVRTVYGGDARALAQAAQKIGSALPVDPRALPGGKGHGHQANIYAAYLSIATDWNVQAVTKSAGWSLPYVALAVYDGLLDPYSLFNPNQAAGRAWATELLVKGFIKAGAMSQSDVDHADLTVLDRFKDKGQFSVEAQPYIAAAVKAGFVDGYPDHTFRPWAAISRAEFSALLARSADQRGVLGSKVTGKVAAVDVASRTLTVVKADSSSTSAATYKVNANALIYVRIGDTTISSAAGALSLADVQPGDQVTIYLDNQGSVALIYDRFELDAVSGEITAVHRATSTTDATTFTLTDNGGRAHDFTLAPYGHVYLKGSEVSLSMLTVGAPATVQYHGSEAVIVRLGSGKDSGGKNGGDDESSSTKLSGTVHDIIAQNAFTLNVVASSNGSATIAYVYTVLTNANTKFEGVNGVAGLAAGQHVKVEGTVQNFVITATKVEVDD